MRIFTQTIVFNKHKNLKLIHDGLTGVFPNICK